eukprot:RCo022334
MGRITVFVADGSTECQHTVRMLEKTLGREASSQLVEINLSRNPRRRAGMVLLARGHKVVPQVFFGDRYIGGHQVILALHDSGQLQKMLEDAVAGPDATDEGLRLPDDGDAEIGAVQCATTATEPEPDHELYYDRLMTMVKHPETGIPVATRMHHLQQHPHCFIGFEMVDWLIGRVDPSLTREEAVRRGQVMMDAGVFNHVGRSEPFRDAYVLYRFQEDEEIDVLNQKHAFSGQIPAAGDQARQLVKVMKEIMAFYITDAGVDYESLANSAEWRFYLRLTTELQRVDLLALSRNERLAFLFNLYHGLVLHGQLALGHPKTSGERAAFFSTIGYSLGGHVFTLNDIHHGLLRGNRVPPGTLKKPFCPSDPRQIFGVTCPPAVLSLALFQGFRGSPPFRVLSAESPEADL